MPVDALTWIKSSQSRRSLITDKVNNGNCLIKRLNLRGEIISGLEVTSSVRIAKELLIRHLAGTGNFRRIREVADDIGAFILEGILREHAQQYRFVPQASLCTATAAEILSNLNMIRENEVTDAYREKEDSKTEQLGHLIREYENRLQEQGLYDRCMLLEAGLKILSDNPSYQAAEPVGLLYTDRISVLEEAFLKAYAPKAIRISFEKPEKIPGWHFYKSYGVWNEAEYILEDMRTKQIPFGWVRIVYTSQDYEPALLAAFGEREIPIQFTSGRPVSGKDSIRMLLSLIQWASDGYRYKDLKSVLLNPLFQIPLQNAEQEEGAGRKTADGLKEFLKGIDDRIGWGLDRYKKFLAEAEKERGEHAPLHTKEYLEFLQDAVNLFDAAGEYVDAAALLDSMTAFVKKYTRRNEDNRIILPLLEKESRELAFMLPLESLEEALSLLKDRLEKLSSEDKEDPGAVAACRLRGLEILDRPYIYVIGLADRHYGSALIESPVLNDLEREKYLDLSIGNVSLCRDKAARRLEEYESSLELSETEEIHMGYCCFDTVKQEMLSPSALFLNMLEKHEAGIEDLPMIEYPRVIKDSTFVTDDAVWGADDSDVSDDSAQAAGEADKSREKKESHKVGLRSRVDKMHSENPDSDGTTELSLFFSPSSLDNFLSCPAKYNYRRIRWIPEEDYSCPDSGVWLSAADKGSYFHLILQYYIEQQFVGREGVTAEMDMDLFAEVFRNATEKILELVPIESPAVAKQEQEAVRDAAVRYLSELHQEFSDPSNPWQVLACEKAFGREGEAGLRQDYAFIPPADQDPFEDIIQDGDSVNSDISGDIVQGGYAVNSGVPGDDPAVCPVLFHLTFSGIIDRLDGYTDQDGKRHYRIVDYKTGNAESFRKYKLENKKGYQTTQHAIYQMYAGQSGSVDLFEYHFPFEEEEGNRRIRIREFSDPLQGEDESVLQELHNSFVLGDFPPKPRTGGCGFCNYSDICLTKIQRLEE